VRGGKGPGPAARLRVFGAMWLAATVVTWPALRTSSAASDFCGPSFTLTATAGATDVSLSWCEPEIASGYNIFEGTSPGNEPTQVNDTPLGASDTSYDVTGLTGGTTYYFVIQALTDGDSITSSEASAAPTATVPGAPTGLTDTPGRSEMGLTWTAPDSDGGSPVTGYDVYQGTAAGGESKVPVVIAASTSVTVTGLTSGTSYYFVVTAVNAVGESPASGEVSAIPLGQAGDSGSQGPSDGPSGSSTGTPGGGANSPGGGANSGGRGSGHHHHHAVGRHGQPSVSPAASSTHLVPPPASLLVAAAAAGAAIILALRRLHKRRPPPGQPRVQVKTDPHTPGKVTVLSTGWQPTVTVRIVPDPGISSTTIEEKSR
jgi:Fibronectin type III domain